MTITTMTMVYHARAMTLGYRVVYLASAREIKDADVDDDDGGGTPQNRTKTCARHSKTI